MLNTRIWIPAKVLKTGVEYTDIGRQCLGLEILDRSKISGVPNGTPFKISSTSKNKTKSHKELLLFYGVVESSEIGRISLKKANGFPVHIWSWSLGKLQFGDSVRLQPMHLRPLLEVFYTKDENDDDHSHNESGDEDAVGDVISDLLNPVSNTADESGLEDPFNTSDNLQQIVANINDAIVDGNINSSDLGTDLKTAGFRVNSVYQGSGRLGAMSADLISFVDIQKSTDRNFIVASVPGNIPDFGFAYTNQVPFKLKRGKVTELLPLLYEKIKTQKNNIFMRVEDNNGTLFHKKICDIRSVIIDGFRTYQFIAQKDEVEASINGRYKNAMVTFMVQDCHKAKIFCLERYKCRFS